MRPRFVKPSARSKAAESSKGSLGGGEEPTPTPEELIRILSQ